MNKVKDVQDVELMAAIKESEAAYIQLIRARLGIIIHNHQTTELYKTIKSACHKFKCHPREYLQMLQDCPDQSPLLDHLIAGITVGETYFFRDKNQMRLLEEKILPRIIKQKRDQKHFNIRVWSAGCASGEEIYTIAILLTEMIPDLKNWTLNFLATDINPHSLKKAMEGRYSEWSMRSIPEYYKNKYFNKDGQAYVLNEKIVNMVKFDYLNLNDDAYPSIFNTTNAQDLILCRNVLIYFDAKRINELMHRLSESLVPGGTLMLGASDPIDIKTTDLTFHHELGIIFTKRSPDEVPKVEKQLTPAIKPLKVRQAEQHPLPNKSVTITSLSASPKLKEQEISRLLETGKWAQVLNAVSHVEDNNKITAFSLNAKATALANIGELESAIKFLKQSLDIDPTNKYTYFTYALTLSELNDWQAAEEALRKTLFLDPQFVAAHYQLGLLLLRNKHEAAGVKCLQNALTIARNNQINMPVPGSQGLTFGRLSELLQYEIELYASKRKQHEHRGERKEKV